MIKNDLFQKLNRPKITDNILLLTHIDMDGAGPSILLQSCFKNVTVRHCSNNTMSEDIKNSILEDEQDPQYDFIIACDISCNKYDAAIINKSKNCNKLVILDHHMTAEYLNVYDWACVSSITPSDTKRIEYIDSKCLQSGTSLMYDYLDYCNMLQHIKNPALCMQMVNTITLYDTWDWVNIYQKQNMDPYKLNTLFSIYGTDMFEETMISRINNITVNKLFNNTDKLLLRIEDEKIKSHIKRIEKHIHTGSLTLKNETYSIVLCYTSDYLQDTFDLMKTSYPDKDIYIINYGTGISMRAMKPDINIGLIAKEYGGGGHPGAGGFKITWEDQLTYLAKTFSGTINVDTE